jgi:hypothetical protein
MIRRFSSLLLAPLLAIGCAEKPEPEPDPAKLDALVASLEAAEQEAGKADRLIASVEKIPPERIDPKLALAVVGD